MRRRRGPWRLAIAGAAGLALLAGGLATLVPFRVDATAESKADRVVGRQWVDLDADWRFVLGDPAGAAEPGFPDTGWAPVTVPHTWNATDGQDGGTYHRGAGWYRRHYRAPADLACAAPAPAARRCRRAWLDFAGANTVTDVWVNGRHLGQHRGGFARFRFDATDALVPGADNVIAVRVSNAAEPDVPPLSADYTFFGGLYRDVGLWVTDPLAVRLDDAAGPGMYLRQRAVTAASATVDVTTKVRNAGRTARRVSARAVVVDAAGATVAAATSAPHTVAPGAAVEVTLPVTINRPRLWQGRADPYLYLARTEVRDAATGVVTDRVSDRLGLRSVTVDPAAGLFLNGKHVVVQGVNRHQDVLGRGWALGPADHVRDFDLMDEMGVNALRTAHYQQDRKVYDLADERGYLVWTEIPLVNGITDSAAFRANAERQLRELIRQNYNHPSVVVWGLGNEQAADDAPTNALLAALAGIVRAEDPERLSTYAHHGPITSRLVDHADLDGHNRYHGWYYDTVDGFGPWVDDLHRRLPTHRIAISEYGAGGSIAQHQENPPRPVPESGWHPEEYQALFHEAYWTQIQARPYLWGTFVWNMFDFAADWRAEGDTAGRNDKGLVTYDRAVRKDAFYWYKANWTATPFVHLTSARWVQRTAATTTVKAYGTADSVRLVVNGVPVGPPRAAAGHVFTWPGVVLAPGPNRVEVIGTGAGSTYTDAATWNLS